MNWSLCWSGPKGIPRKGIGKNTLKHTLKIPWNSVKITSKTTRDSWLSVRWPYGLCGYALWTTPTLEIPNGRPPTTPDPDFPGDPGIASKSLGQKSCRTKVSRIFRIFVPNFAPIFAPNFPRNVWGAFVLRFVGDGDQKKFTKIPAIFQCKIPRQVRVGCTRRGSYSAKGRVSAF